MVLELEDHQLKRLENYIQVEIRKNRLFQSEREAALEEKHAALRKAMLKVNGRATELIRTPAGEPIDPGAFQLACVMFELTETLIGEWDIPEGDENHADQ